MTNKAPGQSRNALRRKPVIAGALLALFLFVLAMAQFKTLHRYCHEEADQTQHQCVVCTLKSGLVDTALVHVAVIPPQTVAVSEPAPAITFVSSADHTLLPSRGPPALLA